MPNPQPDNLFAKGIKKSNVAAKVEGLNTPQTRVYQMRLQPNQANQKHKHTFKSHCRKTKQKSLKRRLK